MGEFVNSTAAVVAAMAVGYVLGAFPMAVWVSRRRGVDIYSVGTGLAGASNVMRTVGRPQGAFVLIWDLVKGGLAVLAGWWIGADGTQVLLPMSAVLMGHWFSVFSGFRGGDGMAPLGGFVIVLFGATGVITVIVALLVAFGGQRMPYPSLLSLVFGYGILAGLSLTREGDMALTAGVGGLTGLVLTRAILGHVKRRHSHDWERLDDSDSTPQNSR